MSQKITDIERQWFLNAADSQYNELKNLLEKDPELVSKKDFMMGFTALHWAAKNGHCDLVKFLLEHGMATDLRTNGGYTPLHLATMYNRDDVVLLLVDNYGASIDVRDNSGKRPKDYLRRNAMPSVKDKLRRTNSSQKNDNPMTNISNMFMQMGVVSSAQPFSLLPQVEKKPEKVKNSIRRSPTPDIFRKAKTKKSTRTVSEDLNAEAKLKISSPILSNNNFFEMTSNPGNDRATQSEPDVARLIEVYNSKLQT